MHKTSVDSLCKCPRITRSCRYNQCQPIDRATLEESCEVVIITLILCEYCTYLEKKGHTDPLRSSDRELRETTSVQLTEKSEQVQHWGQSPQHVIS